MLNGVQEQKDIVNNIITEEIDREIIDTLNKLRMRKRENEQR